MPVTLTVARALTPTSLGRRHRGRGRRVEPSTPEPTGRPPTGRPSPGVRLPRPRDPQPVEQLPPRDPAVLRVARRLEVAVARTFGVV